MIKTKSVYAIAEKDDGFRVLITRFYPRGTRRDKYDVWMRDLSPSQDLLKKYKNNQVEWSEFESSFVSELRDNPKSTEAIDELGFKSNVGDITLLCYERDGLNCHRYMIKDLIEQAILSKSPLESKVVNYKTVQVCASNKERDRTTSNRCRGQEV